MLLTANDAEELAMNIGSVFDSFPSLSRNREALGPHLALNMLHCTVMLEFVVG